MTSAADGAAASPSKMSLLSSSHSNASAPRARTETSAAAIKSARMGVKGGVREREKEREGASEPEARKAE